MKINLIVSALVLLGLLACNTTDLTLIRNGSSSYEIAIPQNADSIELNSSNELQKYLQKITGVSVSISDENKISSNHRIFIGNTTEGEALNVGVDEILIKARDNDLFILGGDSKSTLYAVYTFLENYLGCRFYAPDAEIIPDLNNVTVPGNIDYRYTPPVTTRTVHSRLYYNDREFADKRKVTYEAFPGYVPGFGVHTFNRFVPTSKYYTTHPEYYALRDGRRIPTQLCLTNADVLEIVKDTVASLLKQNTD
jgi:hypothetical protein